MPENLAFILEPCTELSQHGLQDRVSASQGQCAQLKEWGASLFHVFDGRLFQSTSCRGCLRVTDVGTPWVRSHPLVQCGLSHTAPTAIFRAAWNRSQETMPQKL